MPTVIDQQIRRLDETGEELWIALRAPGLDGQAHLFLRLEEMNVAIEGLRREVLAASAEERGRVVVSMEKCRGRLSRLERVFSFLERVIQDHVEEAGDSGGYGGPGRRAVRGTWTQSEGARRWEG